MADYIKREAVKKVIDNVYSDLYPEYVPNSIAAFRECLIVDVGIIPAADVQEKRYCKMIPLEPDRRDCTDVFICTNCHQHIHLGFIRKEYSGSYCLECGAEVKDGDSE